MFVAPQEVSKIVEEFLLEVILPKTPTSAGQFMLGFSLPYLKKMADRKLEENMGFLKLLGVIADNGKIDLEEAHNAALEQIGRQGKIAIGNYMADKDDIESIYQIAQRHATE